MVKPGDTVRYLNEVGGGTVTRVEGRIAYVDDAGFETPVQVSDLVVVVPAGHKPAEGGARLMFDQQAFDTGRTSVRNKPEAEKAPAAPSLSKEKKSEPEPEPQLPVEETEYGDALNITLAFEPRDIKKLSETEINAVLVNDSNYFLQFNLLRRDETEGWVSVYRGEVAPNELIDLASFNQQSIARMERVVLQAIAYKEGKPFEVKTPLNVSRKIDLTKFFKAHCFRPGVYFETPVIEIPLYSEPVSKPVSKKASKR